MVCAAEPGGPLRRHSLASRNVFAPPDSNLDMVICGGYCCRMDSFCRGTTESNRLPGVFWRCDRGLPFRSQTIWLEPRVDVFELEKTAAAFSSTVAVLLRGIIGADFPWSGAVSAQQSHCTDLPHSPSVTLADGRPLALDTYASFSHERARLRDRMAVGTADAIRKNGSVDRFAELFSVSSIARPDF